MKHQFYIVRNPKAPTDPQYVYHAKPPRFFAEIKDNELQLDIIIDEAPFEKIDSKFKRMKYWFRDYLLNKKSYETKNQ